MMEELKITAKKYIKMAQDNKKIVMAGVIVIIVIIILIVCGYFVFTLMGRVWCRWLGNFYTILVKETVHILLYI